MGDLISRQAAIATAVSGLTREIDGEKWIRVSEVRRSIKEVPSAESRPKGKWIVQPIESRPKGCWVGIDEEPHEEWECSNCGNIINTNMADELNDHKYCHKCGAEMSTPWIESEGEKE